MSLFIEPDNRASDANGALLSGAKRYFYLTNTTTLADVYTTAAMDVAHANPVVADSGGLFPVIYIDPAITYRTLVKTSAGALVPGTDIDPYNVATTAPQPSLFGVVGDDTTDDTAALQAWIDYCDDNDLDVICNTTLFCKITDTITFPADCNIDVEGIRFRYTGARTKPALSVTGALCRTLKFGSITSQTIDWTNVNFVGLRLCDVYSCHISFQSISNFTEGYELSSGADYGCAYNEIHPRFIRDCKYCEVLRTTSALGFVNENTFYSGNYGNTSSTIGLADAYGVFLTWDHSSSYRGHNNNRWLNPNFELAQAAGATYRVPFLFDGVGLNNTCEFARSETNKGPFAILDAGGTAGVCYANTFGITYSDNAAQTNSILQVDGAYGNIITGPGAGTYTWTSPDLGPCLTSNGGADAPYLSGGPMFLMETSIGTPSRTATVAGAARTARDALQLNSTGVFVAIDTTLIKTFRANLACVPGFGGRLVIIAWDGVSVTASRLTGTATDATWGNEKYVKSVAALTTTTEYGGGYATSADGDALDLLFTVRDEVKKIHIGYIGGTSPLAARQITITGYGMDESASNTDATGAMRVFADLDDNGTQLLATAKPDTSGTHGYYQRGQVVTNASAAAGQVAGWQCSTTGWLAAAWTSSTAYSILGRIVTNDTGKMYQLITAGTSAGSGGPTGTTADITDGTCHWKYVGVKAVFVAMAVTS